MELVLRGGYVLTMDPGLGDLPVGDVHVVDGRIAAVAPRVDAPGATVLDVRDEFVLPGIVDTHWHLWNTLLRGMSDRRGMSDGRGYFATSAELGRWFEPDDMYQGTRLSCAEAVCSGITTVHDWAHNVRGPEYARASLRALAESGLRGRFSYGFPAGHAPGEPMDLDDLAALNAEWPKFAAGGLLSLGVAVRGQGGGNPAMRVPESVYRREFEAARSLGLPVSVHASGPPRARGQLRDLAGLLGPDLLVVHANNASDEEIGMLAEAGAGVSLSPFTELEIGYGFPKTAELLAAGIPVGLSVDTTVLSGNADPFAIMKLTHAVANSLAHNEFELSPRRVLELATVEGARVLGLDDETGSLRPGKCADVITVSARGANIGVVTDPARLLVTAAQPADVRTVLVQGNVLKQDGEPAFDLEEITAASRAALARVLSREAAS
jgi:5-methylthioadenosine/S-adenosylhomocysteine deaminase